MKNKLLKEKRELKNFSQVELAKLIGINANTYVQYELGYRAIPFEVAQKIANILEIDIDDFFAPKYLTLRK